MLNRKRLEKLTGSFDEYIVNSLKNKKKAAIYLQVAIELYEEDGNVEALLLAFRDVAQAQGGIAKLAEKANLNRESLYKTLSSKGNPKLKTLGVLLKALGFKLIIKPA